MSTYISQFKRMLAFGIITITLPFGSSFGFVQASAPTQASLPAVNSGVGSDASLNWSGYAATGGPFTSVSGTWTIPVVPPASSTEADASWVGIGGVTGQDLIQAGTQAVTDRSGGVSYQAWYETLPQATQPISLAVNGGDSITASLSETAANTWQISVRDNTTGQSYENTITYASSLSSAEWIEEMPSDGNSSIPLDNFGTISFSGASAVMNGSQVSLSGAGARPITMITQAGQTLASPSAIGGDGASFNVVRSAVASVASSPANGYGAQGGRPWRRVGVGVRGFRPISTGVSVGDAGSVGPAVIGFRRQFSRIFQEFVNAQYMEHGLFHIGNWNMR